MVYHIPRSRSHIKQQILPHIQSEVLVCAPGLHGGLKMFPSLYEYKVRPYWLCRPIDSVELRWLYQCFKQKLKGEDQGA
jgi:hypothetical protein